jgi:hypothetical protein
MGAIFCAGAPERKGLGSSADARDRLRGSS